MTAAEEADDSLPKIKPLTPNQRRLIIAAAQIAEYPPDRNDFLHTVMCQVGMPRRATEARTFERTSGHLSIQLEAGKLWNGREWIQQPLPYGTTPRLVMVHVSSEAIRTQSRRVDVGDSMRQFLLKLGMGDGGGPRGGYTAIRKQVEALAACRLTIGMQEQGKVASVDSAIQAYDDILVAEGRAKKTLSKYRKVFERVKSLAAERGVADMRGIDLSFADAYRKMRAAAIAPKTMHVELTVLKQLGNFAFRRELIATNPLRGLKLKRPKNTPQPWWTLVQLNLILSASKASPYHALFCMLAWTGMRIGEAKHLTWDDVDFDQGVLHIREKWIGPGKHDKWTPKGHDQRVVPLCDPALALLRSISRVARWVFTGPPTAQHPECDRQIDERRALFHLKKVLKTVGLEGKLHSFRHSLISHALANGTPEASVRAWAGHVDGEILKVYTHVADKDSKAQMARLFPMPKSADLSGGADEPGTKGGDAQP